MDEYYAHIRMDSDTHQAVTQTVQAHCDACAAYAEAALSAVGLGRTGALCGHLHDGKMTRAFQEYLWASFRGESVRRGAVNHTFLPMRYLLERYHTPDADGMEALTAELIAYAIGAHHGLFDCTDIHGANGFAHRLEAESALYEEHMGNFLRLYRADDEIDALFREAVAEISRIGARLPGLEDDTERDFAFGALARLLSSALMEGDRRDTAVFMHGGAEPPEPAVDWEACLRALERHLRRLQPTRLDDVRGYISEECRKRAEAKGERLRLHVPPGGGKTFAALRFALTRCAHGGKKRIFFVMPLLAIIDQNVKALRQALGDTVEILEHHSNVVTPRQEGDELDVRELLCASWRAPVVCTTLVQFLETLFSGKTTCVRRFQALCDSVVVLDEVQNVPVQMLSQFNLMVNFLTETCNATVVFCSATQPVEVDMPHPHLPALDAVPADPARFAALLRTEILPPPDDPMTMEEIAAWCRAQLMEINSLLVVCNTRDEAARLFARLEEMGMPCVHLSASMCPAHRKRVLARLENLSPEEKIVCVSTQVVETGVDISVQRVGRFLAGLDSVIQAAGRCNRNGESGGRPGKVQILALKGEKLPAALQSIQAGQIATGVILSRYRQDPSLFGGRLDSDAAVQAYYRELFHGFKADKMDYPLGRRTMLDLLSTNAYSDGEGGEQYYLHQAFREAGRQFRVFDEETADLVVPYGDGARLIAALRHADLRRDFARVEDLVRALRPFTVSVYRQQLRALEARGAIETIQAENLGILALLPDFYDPALGLYLPGEKRD